jgi:YfiH family protein
MNRPNRTNPKPGENTFFISEFASPLLFHRIFNRHGGVSPAPWDSQNISFDVGDARPNVVANRDNVKKTLDCTHLVSARQVHGSMVYIVEEKPGADLLVAGYDALVTNIPGPGLMIQQADCQAVMLFDPVNIAVGIAHAGWRGSVAGILPKTVSAMVKTFATDPADLLAAISPSLGPCCAEFINYRSELPDSMHGYRVRSNHFDFWAISREQLCRAGLQQKNIHTAGICTCCNPDYFSYRRDRDTGRSATVIGIRES